MNDVDLIIGRSLEGAKLQSTAHGVAWGFGKHDWHVNLDEGIICFSGDDGFQAVASAQVVGTFNTLDDTFLWAWDHPSIPPERAAASLLARAFGEKHRLSDYTTAKVECPEGKAWEFAAVTNYLSDLQGVYRGPSGTAMVFLAFGTVTLSQSED